MGQISCRTTWMNIDTDKPKTPSVKILLQERLQKRKKKCHVGLALWIKGPIWSVSLVR